MSLPLYHEVTPCLQTFHLTNEYFCPPSPLFATVLALTGTKPLFGPQTYYIPSGGSIPKIYSNAFLCAQVSKKKSEEANRGDYTEWSVSDRLKRHPNVLQVFGLCPSFRHVLYQGVGTTAIISPWQANGALRTFYDNRALRMFVLLF